MDAFSIITALQSQVQTKSLQVRFYNLQNGTDIWIDGLCWRLYDFNMKEYLHEEYGIDFEVESINYDIMDADDEFIIKTCFLNGVFRQTRYDTIQELLVDYDEDVITAALAVPIDLGTVGDCYQGKYESFEKFCEDFWMETESHELPEKYLSLIDFSKVADLWQGDYHFENGHVFRA